MTARPGARAALACGGLVALLLAACAALAWAPGAPARVRPGGALAGDAAWGWAFVAAAAGAFAVYLLALALIRRRPPRLAHVAALAAAVQLVPLAAPLLVSSDAWTYWSYGRIAAVHGEDPYERAPGDVPGDVATRYAGSAWRDRASVYGPAFTLASMPVARAAGSSPDAAAWAFRALAAAASLAAAWLASRVARRRALALALAGWNPVLALHAAGGGHNDAWMAALAVGALAAAAAGRRGAAGVCWALAALVKWIPLLLLPLRALEARATGRPVRHAGFAAAAAGVALAATALWGTSWVEAFGPLASNASRETSFALPHRLASLGVPSGLAVALFAVGFAVLYAWLLVEARRGRARLALASGALLVAVPYLAAWYVFWAVPLAAADDDDRTARVLALALCAYLLPQRLLR